MKKFFFASIIFAFFLCIFAPSVQALMFSDIMQHKDEISSTKWKFADSDTGLGYDINVKALGGDLTWNLNDGGLGIGDDEIGGREAMLIWYSKPLHITSFKLVDLFNEGPDNSYRENGFYAFDSNLGDGLWPDGYGRFWADPGEKLGGEGPLAGAFSLDINDMVQGIALFGALGDPRSDFAVAGYTTPVPEPSTILLLGLGLVGLAGFGRKKLKQ